MPVVIVGSGRCGTSMVAGMLRQCGLFLGDDVGLQDASPMNPKGYWEHQKVRSITDGVLGFLTQRYGAPGLAPNGWQDDPDLAPFYADAEEFVQTLSHGGEPWGWKYPQTSLIIPFWRSLVPGIKVVLCVRNPLDVSSSLLAYGSFAAREGRSIWLVNTMKVLLDTMPGERIVTFYEDYFPDYREALFPVLDFVGLKRPEPESELERALAGFHDSGLKHHSSSVHDLIQDNETPYLVKELYLELLTGERDASDLRLTRSAEAFMHFAARTVAADAAEHERRHLEDILNSRTHRIATAICSFLIRSPLMRFRRRSGEGRAAARLKGATPTTPQPKVAGQPVGR